ncbi:hypothetical protein HNV12_02605 [Methanococcoides sp. SA1]|nr:hypothetical protein [Methanococcoides sp. SA1]
MGLFKKDEKIPSIPKAPTLPELPQPEGVKKKNLPELPTFPANSQNENLNQAMVKSAVAETSATENEVSVDIPTGVHVREIGEEDSGLPTLPSIAELPKETPELPPIPTAPQKINVQVPISTTPKKVSLNEPIFVRIDKFQSSQKNLDSIKEKIGKIEVVMKKIEDVRSKEEAELKGWIEDISQIKSRLAEVDKNIFDQI